MGLGLQDQVDALSFQEGGRGHEVDHQVAAHAGHGKVRVLREPGMVKATAEQELDAVRDLFGVHRGGGIAQRSFPDVAGGGRGDAPFL